MQLCAYERMRHLTERPEGQAIIDLILNDGHSIVLTEAVGVDPALVGATTLFIRELSGRVPTEDPGLPAKGNPKETQPVVDECPFAEGNRLRCQDLERKFRRCDVFQVAASAKN
jgi:hypothetical protein